MPAPAAADRQYHYWGQPTNFQDRGVLPQFFDGLLDDIRLWSTARAVNDIRTHRLQPLPDPVPSAELLFLYTVDTDSGVVEDVTSDDVSLSVLQDTSGNGAHAELHCQHGTGCRALSEDGKTVCGDGSRNSASEQCDDGNLSSGDGCSATCQLEAGWSCFAGQFGATQTCRQGTDLHQDAFESAAAAAAWNPVVGKTRVVGAAALQPNAGVWESSVAARYQGSTGLRIRHDSVAHVHESALPSGMHLWLRADAGVTASGGAVSTWQDQSGNGFHATVPSGASQPGLEEAALNGLPVVRFPAGSSGLVVADDSSAVGTSYTIFAVTGYFSLATPTGVLIHSMDSTFRFGVCDAGTGWYTPASDWVHNSGDADRDDAGFNWMYLSSGVAADGSMTLYRDSAKVASVASTSTAVGRLALHNGGVSPNTNANADIAELIVYPRALDDHDRRVVEQYLAAKYGMSGPHALLASETFATSPDEFVTYGSRAFAGTVGASTALRFAVRVESAPASFGVPLWFMMFREDGAGSSTPLATQCTTRDTCGGRTFYSLCFNGGNAFIHCDETIEQPLQEWRQRTVEVHAKFAAKYGVGNEPSALRVSLAAIGGAGEAAEAWVDDVTLTTYDDTASCGAITATSTGTEPLDDVVHRERPLVRFNLDEDVGAATVTDATGGLFFPAGPVTASTSAGVTLGRVGLVQDSGTAAQLTGTAFVQVASHRKLSSNNGYTVEMWLHLESVSGTGRATLVSDAFTGTQQLHVAVWDDLRLYASFSTSRGVAAYSTNQPLETGVTVYVAVRYHAADGAMSFYVNGDNAAATADSSTSDPPRNQGYPLNVESAWRVGYDAAAGDAASVVFTVDSVALYDRPLTNTELFWHFDAARTPYVPADGTITVGSSTYGFAAAEEGVRLVVVGADDMAVKEQHLYDVNNPDLGVANAALASMATFLGSAGIVNSGNYVVGVAKALSSRRRLLYEDNMHPTAYMGFDMHPSSSYYTMDSSTYAGYPKTWSGAQQFCEDRDRYLCDLPDYCWISTWPTTAFIPTYRGQVEGFGWTPYLPRDPDIDVGNNWLSLGRAYGAVVCCW